MKRALFVLVALAGLVASASPKQATNTLDVVFDAARGNHRSSRSIFMEDFGVSGPQAQYCCKICTVGKACGNTCISRDKTCHVGPGCACDG